MTWYISHSLSHLCISFIVEPVHFHSSPGVERAVANMVTENMVTMRKVGLSPVSPHEAANRRNMQVAVRAYLLRVDT